MAELDPAVVRAEAERKVRAALDHVEAAQRELERATQELCPIIGALPAWRRLGALTDRVHNEWRRLRYEQPKRGYSLDEDGRRALEKRLAAQKPEAPDA
jgi:hypothetical protein